MSLWPLTIVGATLFVAYANGANDNLATSFLVIVASKWGLPVSTTHVSCGALFGIGIANGQARWPMIRTILLAWVLTLPTAAFLSGTSYIVLKSFI